MDANRLCCAILFFFFQAEDGIRDRDVTGVQTCALPICAALDEAARLESSRAAAALAAGTWQSLGPANVGGRVTDLAVDPVHTDTVYAGAATGGVWKSVDAGRTFTSAWNPALPPPTGALAVTPSGVLYAGTGEASPGGGSATFPGHGV